MVIGKAGSKIKEIRDQTGANIQVFPKAGSPEAARSSERVISIIGQRLEELENACGKTLEKIASDPHHAENSDISTNPHGPPFPPEDMYGGGGNFGGGPMGGGGGPRPFDNPPFNRGPPGGMFGGGGGPGGPPGPMMGPPPPDMGPPANMAHPQFGGGPPQQTPPGPGNPMQQQQMRPMPPHGRYSTSRIATLPSRGRGKARATLYWFNSLFCFSYLMLPLREIVTRVVRSSYGYRTFRFDL